MGNVYQSDQTFVTVEISTTGKISRLPLFVRMGSFILSTAASLKDIFSLWMYAHIRGGVCVCARVLTHAGVSRYQRSVPGITSMTLYYYIEAESLTEPRSHIFLAISTQASANYYVYPSIQALGFQVSPGQLGPLLAVQ